MDNLHGSEREKLIEKMLEAGERLGITHGAARILKEAIL